MAEDYESLERATARGERIRAALLAKLTTGGPQTAAALADPTDGDVSLSEIAFQLNRLAEEGKAAGEHGGEYRAL